VILLKGFKRAVPSVSGSWLGAGELRLDFIIVLTWISNTTRTKWKPHFQAAQFPVHSQCILQVSLTKNC